MKDGGEKYKKLGYKSEKKIIFAAEKIIENALNLRATDVHIEPRENFYVVRFRINGALSDFENLSTAFTKKLIKHFKFIGEMNFSEKNFTQTAKIIHGNARIRISVSPTFLGEKVTLRIISAKSRVRTLEEIGLWGENLRLVRQAIRQPNGIIFTIGRGKNNTNFAMLNELISDEKNIVTVEKNIEKGISKINQTEINPRIGIDYFQATKAALSQNPDIIMIDDLRDKKTAELVFDAALRGKLLIVSLPIRKISEFAPYLEFLGIPNFLIATNTLAIVSQNLIRTISKNACQIREISQNESNVILQEFNITISKLHQLEKSAQKYLSGKKLHTSDNAITEILTLKNEKNIHNFDGTTGIFEVASFLDGKFGRNLKSIISTSPNSAEIEDFLEENNFITLKIDGLLKSLQGKTTIKEIINRVGF